MGEYITKHPHWVAIIALGFSVFISSVGFAVGYGSLNNQVDINKDDINYIKNNMVDKDSMMVIQSTLTVMQQDIKELLKK